MLTVNSMRTCAPSSRVQITWVLFSTSMSDGASIWPAVTTPGPLARRVMRLGPSECMRSASCLMFRMMSTTSSRHALHGGELVHHAVDLHRGDGRALQRGQQHTAQGIAERHAEAAFQRFGHHARLALAVGAEFDLGLLGTDQVLPVSFDHDRLSNGVRAPKANPAKDGRSALLKVSAGGGQTRRRLGGRQPLCGIGVTSRIAVMEKPTA